MRTARLSTWHAGEVWWGTPVCVCKANDLVYYSCPSWHVDSVWLPRATLSNSLHSPLILNQFSCWGGSVTRRFTT